MVSVVLPAYNERRNVLALIQEIHEVLRNVSHEILIVDDDSSDGTLSAVEGLSDPCVKVFVRREDKGLAKAIRHGIERAHGETLVVMDSDFNHPPQYIPLMLDALRTHDCVSGSRFLSGGGMLSPWHLFFTRWFNVFVRWVIRGRILDNSYGFYGIRKEAVGVLDFDKIFWGHGDYCIRLMYYLQKRGVSILEIPIVNGLRRYGRPNRQYIRNFCRYFGEVLKLVFKEQVRCAG